MPTGDFPPPDGMKWTDAAGWVSASSVPTPMTGPVTTEALVASLREANERFAKAEIALQQVTAERDEEKARADRNDAKLAEITQPWVDDKGGVWLAPTAWAYAKACGALHQHRDRANVAEASLATATSELARLRAERRRADVAEAFLATANVEIARLRDEGEALKADRDDAIRMLDVWFDTSTKTNEQVVPQLVDALVGYLRTCRCGGMPAETSDMIEAGAADFIRRRAGYIIAPVIEAMVAERTASLRAEGKAKDRRIAALEAALAPFAKAGGLFGPRQSNGWDVLIYSPAAGDEYCITADHLRAARAATAREGA